jgi:hypothetical protein
VSTKKKDLSIVTYFSALHWYADEMVAAGKVLDDDEIVPYILNGLDEDYNSLIEQINGMTEPISPETLYSCLLDTEVCLASQKVQQEQKVPYSMMVHVVARGNNNSDSKLHRSGFQNHRGGGRSNGGSGHGNPNPYKDHQCRGKLGHTALLCWKHFDKGYNGSVKMVHAATSSYTLDMAWYADSPVTDHITGDLDNLSMKEYYGSQDQVHVANDSGMTIKLVGQSIVSTLS